MTDDIAPDMNGTDIAVVGMAGRFPGAADVAGLWATIRAGRSGITRFTDAELRAAGVPEERLADPDFVPVGAVVEGIDRFDAAFFGFNPKEAQILDPQHRLFLEASWHALEDASCDPARFDGSVGVFGGCAISTYWTSNLRPAGAEEALGAMAVGLANDKDSLTLRVAHTLRLAGPAYGVQSYCSTSLVAVCAAATSLANLECDLALAGGVAIAVPDRTGYVFQPGGISSPDGECRAFDASGQGSLIGNGVGVVALRRLEDALADGDRVYAVIRGWAVNNDAGRKVGFTAPGVAGQAAVVAEALGAAGLDPADIDYVEAHGTGTSLGDAAELAALQQVFSGQEVLIGSVKTNLGHLDRAAGVTGLIKAVLSLHHGEIPATLNHSSPNPQMESGDARLTVVTERTPWERGERVRRAGVSAFGIGGTNAHVVLEEAPPVPAAEEGEGPEVLVWSARTSDVADEATARLAAHLSDEGEPLADTAFTLQTGRRVFEHRRALVASDRATAAAALAEGEVFGRTDSTTDRPVAFLISGTGEHYEGMAAELYATRPVFREAIDECRAVLAEVSDQDLLAEMLRPRQTPDGDGDLARLLGRGGAVGGGTGDATDRLQPALFAVEYALARLVQSWGITPSVMVGYSLGEYVAAALAGVLSAADAVRLVAHRARLIHALPAGAMAAVPMAADAVRTRIAAARITGLDVAALNGPEITVVSGTPEALSAFEDAMRRRSMPIRRLATTHAFHSGMLEPARAELTAWIERNATLHAPRIPYVSNVTGKLITPQQAQDPGYWAEHMCGPVHFDEALSTLLAQGEQALLEIGPGQSLTAMARGHRDCARERWALVGTSLPGSSDPRGAETVLADTVARLWLAGVPIDWKAYREPRPARRTGAPGYPFLRERHWIDAPAPVAAPPAPSAAPVAAAPAGGAPVELTVQQWTPDPAGAAAGSASAAGTAGARGTANTPGAAGTPGTASALSGSFTLVSDAGDVADALAGLLRADGCAVRVTAPAEFSLAGAGSGAAATTVVHLAALNWDAQGADEPSAVLSAARTAAACGESAADVRLLVATRGGQAVSAAERPVPAQAAVAAVAVVAGQEYVNLDATNVDLDPAQGPEEAARALAAELRRTSGGAVSVAYRAGQRLVQAHASAETGDRPTPPVRPGGAYLLTGGLSDVGLTLAEHLARGGAARLILAGRGGTPQDGSPRAAAVGRLRALGADVLTPALDVTDPAALAALFAAHEVDGVAHLAADTSESTFVPLRDVDEAVLRRQFSAKVGGARALAEVIAALPAGRAPRWCAVFSSTSALLGGIAFGGYAAANAALTAVALGADAERGGGTRWTSAAWDTWSATLARLDGRRGASMVAHSMADADALAAFDRAVGGPLSSVIVVAGGLDDRLPGAQAAAGADATGRTGGGSNQPRPDLPQPFVPPLTATERLLAGLWTEVLGVEPVGTRDNFFDLGGNSLLGLQMLANVKKRAGIVLPSVTLFEAPTVHALARMLDERGGAPVPAAPAAPAARPAPAVPAAPVAALPVPRAARPADRGADEDRRIAIVGMAGRFPGAGDVSAFWRNLCGGVESVRFFTEEELLDAGVPLDVVRDPAYVPARPVLDDVAGFDASFFGLSPRMAALTDPQQRLFLEVCWEALEQSGYCVPEHRGRVGVYGGANISTYLLGLSEQVMSDEDISSYEIIMGNDKDALTTTVSYMFDLYGPSVAVQTFCSTSLVATHLAVQSLRAGECELAMAGGVSVRVPDRVGHVYTAGGQESPDGHVRAFDAQARGSMFGDGAAVVVLKRLSDALRDGDHVWGVIRGSAMNNDGALKAGYTAPSVVGQSRVIADAMADAGVTAEDIGYVEAHGTGTVLGDPIEVAALTRAFGPTERRQYCPIGSVKPNVGHLDRAAGVTGLIKTALSLSERVIPPTLHYTAPNPEIDFANSPFYVNALLSPWPAPEGRARTAGLNSLGMGGTNVHVVVEEPPVRPAPPAGDPVTSRRYHVLPVSAGGGTAADEACARLAAHLRERPQGRLSDVAFTLQVGRKTFEHRRAAVAASTAEAAAVLGGGAGAAALVSRVEAARGRPVVFHFGSRDGGCPTGLGELYRREPVFQTALDDMIDALGEALADAADRTGLEALLTADVRALLCGSGTPAPYGPGVARVLWTAVDLALVATLAAWGVRPATVSGSGTGGVTAACVRDGLTAREALALAVRSAADPTRDEAADAPAADPDAVLVLFGDAPAAPGPLTTAFLAEPGDPRPSDAVLTAGLADLWLTGADVDWAAYHGRRAGEAPEDPAAPGRIPLPTYPFQRRRYWIERQERAAGPAVAAVPTCLRDIDELPLLPEEQWLNQPVWRQTTAGAPGTDQPASWLVFADGGAGEGVLAGLRADAGSTGATVTAVRPGTGFRQQPDGYTVRPGSIEDALALLNALDDAGTGLDRVVHLWNLGVAAGDERAALARGPHTLVALARAAGELGLGGWELDIVAPGAHAVLGGGEVRPEAATLIGPALVVPLEYPSVTTRLIDAEDGTRPAAVLAELRRERTEPVVALRGTRRYVRDYEVLPPAAPEQAAAVLRENGVYLITGGLGGIGLAMASRLAREARARLVLLGRTGLPPRERWSAIASGAEPADGVTRDRVAQVLELLALGAQVEIVVGDVAEPEAVRRAVDLARERFGALHGVLHTAGVPGIGLIQFKQPEDCDVVLAPKVDGVRALAEALRFGEPDEAELDFLALFSSITSVTGGGPGQVDYCAANAYLDAQAARLAADGRRVVSICWGEWTWNAWQEGLSGYDDDLQSFFRQHRERFGIGFEEGWRTLLRALAAGEPGVVVSTQDLPTIARYAGLFNIEAVTAPASAGDASAPRYPRPELLTPYREPQDPAQQRIAAAWRETLKLEQVGVDDNFFELGGNSLLGIPLLAELRSAYPGAKLPPHILYEAPTVATLARIVEGPVAVGAPAGPEGTESGARAQALLRRSGVQAAAARRRRA